MILVMGSLTSEDTSGFKKAKEHLIDTEKHHQIYGTRNIITLEELRQLFIDIDDKSFFDLVIHILSCINTVYMLKNWDTDNDTRLLHDYCGNNGYKIIYSKKF